MANYCITITNIYDFGGVWAGCPFVAGYKETIVEDPGLGWYSNNFSLDTIGGFGLLCGPGSTTVSMSGGQPVPGNYSINAGTGNDIYFTLLSGDCSVDPDPIDKLIEEFINVTDDLGGEFDNPNDELITVTDALSVTAEVLIEEDISITDQPNGGLLLQELVTLIDSIGNSGSLPEFITAIENFKVGLSSIEEITITDETSISIGGKILDELIMVVTRTFLEVESSQVEFVTVSDRMYAAREYVTSLMITVVDTLSRSSAVYLPDTVTVSDVLHAIAVTLDISCPREWESNREPVVLTTDHNQLEWTSTNPTRIIEDC